MQGQISAIFLLCMVFFSSNILFSTGCKGVDERYNIMLDSIDHNLKQNREVLNIDLATIKARTTLIEDHLRLIDMFLKDTMTFEFGNQLSKYKGVKKAYQKMLADYDKCHTELEALEKQAIDLRASVEKKELDKETFKQYYAKEKLDGQNNLHASQKLIEPVHSVEPDYQRISRVVSDKLNAIAEKDTSLKEILKQMAEAPNQ